MAFAVAFPDRKPDRKHTEVNPMTRWKSFTVEAHRQAIDAVSRFFIDNGSLGTAYDEQLLGAGGDPADPVPPPGEVTRLTAYFPWETDLGTLKKSFLEFLPVLHESFGDRVGAFVSAADITDFGWAENWKEHFKPARVSGRIVIRPSWEAYAPAPGDVVLIIDPGQAFGTGTHETTRMCLVFLDEFYGAGDGPRRVLDVGTGTGILGIAAAKLGAGEVLGLDTDPKAVEVAAENASVNGVASAFRAAVTPLHDVRGEFDMVVANIIAEILIDMKDEILGRLVPGGRILLSGILAEKAGWVRDEYEQAGARFVEERLDGQWAALTMTKEDAAG